LREGRTNFQGKKKEAQKGSFLDIVMKELGARRDRGKARASFRESRKEVGETLGKSGTGRKEKRARIQFFVT